MATYKDVPRKKVTERALVVKGYVHFSSRFMIQINDRGSGCLRTRACELAKVGFDYFTAIDDVQIFRKRK